MRLLDLFFAFFLIRRPVACWRAKKVYNGVTSPYTGHQVPAYGDSLWVCERCGMRCW